MVSALRAGWPVCIPLALFGSLYQNSTLGSTPDYGSALHLVNVGDSIGLKQSTRFKDYPVSDISEKEWSIISVNMPRMIAEEFVPLDEIYVGGEVALGTAQMFADMFHSIQSRADYNIAFGQYKEYADRGYKDWHAYPTKEISLSYFNERRFQEVLNLFQTMGTANAIAAALAKSANSSSAAQTSSTSRKSQRGDRSDSFRNKTSRRSNGSNGSSEAATLPELSCWICGGKHKFSQHNEKDSDYVRRRGKKWVNPSDQSVCIGWNGPNGCSYKDCSYIHQCGRCGNSGHTSRTHT